MGMTIDCDMLSQEPFDERMIAAGGKLFYVASEIFGIEVAYCGGGLVHTSAKGEERIKLVEEYASKYPKMRKTMYERLILSRLKFSATLNNIKKFFNTFKRILKLIKILYW